MATPTTPVITSPYSGADFYTNRRTVSLAGTTDVAGVASIEVTSTSGTVTVSYTSGTGAWSALIEEMDLGANRVVVQAISDDATPLPSLEVDVTITVEETATSGDLVTPPSGLGCDASLNSVVVTWRGNTEEDISGYNVYASFDPAGGTSGYTLLNSTLITDPDQVVTEASLVSETISQAGDTRTTTTTETVQNVEMFRYEFTAIGDTALTVGTPVYIVVTASVFNASEQREVESTYSGELPCVPLNVSALDILIPTRPREKVVDSYVTAISDADQLIDLKPGTTTNDVHIQPPSTEFEKVYFLIDFAVRSQSFATLLPLDDSDGDGVSDPVSESSYKQALQVALNNPSDTEVQDFIDGVFEARAASEGVTRAGASPASGPYLFWRTSRPQRDVEVPVGSVVSAPGDAAEGQFSQQYVTTTGIFVAEEDLDDYYNASNSRYEFPSFIQAIVPGSEGNQDALAINVVNSGPSVSLQGENPAAFENGTDEDSNYRLATRTIAAKSGVDTSSEFGYIRTALSIPAVQDVKVVGADDCDMQRDWDLILRRHGKCMVDIYIKGQASQECVDELAYVYGSNTNNPLTIVNPATFTFEVSTVGNTLDVSSSNPIFEVSRVYNVTKAAFYDLDCVTFDGTEFTVDSLNATNSGIGLDAGDTVVADFRWKSGSPLVLTCQPVTSISSVVGESSGTLTQGENYFLDSSEDPLVRGNSTKAEDSVVILPGAGAEYEEEAELNGGVPYQLLQNPVLESSIVVTDASGLTIYEKDVDYEVSTCQRYAFYDEDLLADFDEAQPLQYKFVDTSTIEVHLGPTPTPLTYGVDYSIEVSGDTTSIIALLGGSLTPGDPLQVDYRVTQPVRLTEINRLVSPTPITTIADGETVTVTYNVEVPDGKYVLTEAEEVTLVGISSGRLARKGAVTSSIVVYDPEGSSPANYDLGIDYIIVEGDGDTATGIQRLVSGSIPDGKTVAVDYLSAEKYTVTYTYNDLLTQVQDKVNITKNAGADVLVKDTLQSRVDVSLTAVPLAGVDADALASSIRVAVANFFGTMRLGENLYQNDIVRAVDAVEGVNHTVLPLLKLARSENTLVVRETMRQPNFALWAEDVSQAYKSAAGSLRFLPQDAGGSIYEPRGVYEDDHPLFIVDEAGLVEEGFNRAYISSDGSITVSPLSKNPTLHTYTVTYQVGSSSGVYDIFASPLEYLTLGDLEVIVADPEIEGCTR